MYLILGKETAYFVKVVLILNCIHDCTGILKQ